ncbi:connective tissue growth factor [Plakobranchus ocellatus]|uniref:Connective tissue growth factor n=1 Tax=Plakobranchus ocellatus TaxID=259542 RepID=A0AAV3YXQ4_9GAST|nr:connective tissue growth factor [Plakobranchus ocellatus]
MKSNQHFTAQSSVAALPHQYPALIVVAQQSNARSHAFRCTSPGDFQLEVKSSFEHIVDLEWLNFAPPDYRFEYVVLQREGTYDPDISHWRVREIGNQPRCELSHLKPDTVYFIRVAIWEDARAGILGKMTEAISVKTHPTEFCKYEGGDYPVGEYVVTDCEENCTCLGTGEFQCLPLCLLQGLPEVEEGCHVIQGENCCDFQTVCPVGGEPCNVGGVIYPHASQFKHNCRQCRCDHGQSKCDNPGGCPEVEPTEQCPNPRRVDVEGQCCPEWYCSDPAVEACHYGSKDYKYGEYFSSQNCRLCQCYGIDGVQCPPECPPAVMVLPSNECPNPQIRREGCCDTLYCNYSNMSLPQFIGRMFAQSYSPVSLTVSFEASPVSAQSEYPLYSQYEILFANMSDPLLTWHRRVVQPVDVRLRRDWTGRKRLPSLTTPLDALTRDNAIVVSERVYITLSGMDPDTTYYVKINPMIDFNHNMMAADQGGKRDNVATVVVQTMPLANATSCFYEGRQFRHGQMVKATCSESCRCNLGQVKCSSNCHAELVVLARSPSCPQPRLEKAEGACCPEWKCYPSATGCLYEGRIMSSGQYITKGCDVCTCENTIVTCSTTCLAPGVSPRSGCVLTNVTGQCCPQWTCPIESHPPYGVKTSIVVYLDQGCPDQSPGFTQDLERQLLDQAVTACSENQSGISKYCSGLQAKAQCPDSGGTSSNNRRKREASIPAPSPTAPTTLQHRGKIRVQIFLSANFSQESPNDLTEELLQSAGLQLAGQLNRSLLVQTSDGDAIKMVQVSPLPQVSYICDAGFSFEEGNCVLSEVETSLTTTASIKMKATDVTEGLAVITWEPLSDRAQEHVTELMVEHRQKGHLEWTSNSLSSTRTSYLLKSLVPDQNYTVRLVASTTWPGQRRWIMAELTIKTLQQAEGSAISVKKVAVFPDSAIVSWDKIPAEIASAIVSAEIQWRKAHEKGFGYRQKMHELDLNSVQILGLTEDTTYTAKLSILLKSGARLQSGEVYFVTKSHKESHFEELLVAGIVAGAVGLVVGILLTLAFVLWRRSKAGGGAGGFVNETYGVQVNKDQKDVPPAANPGVV